MRTVVRLSVIGCLLFFSCKQATEPLGCGDGEYLMVGNGTFFGGCAGYCRTAIWICENGATFTASSWLETRWPDVELTGAITGEEWERIVEAVERSNLSALDDVLGCPDCADGGGEWIEVRWGSSSKRVTFEYVDSIASIQALLDQVRPIRKRFDDKFRSEQAP